MQERCLVKQNEKKEKCSLCDSQIETEAEDLNQITCIREGDRETRRGRSLRKKREKKRKEDGWFDVPGERGWMLYPVSCVCVLY